MGRIPTLAKRAAELVCVPLFEIAKLLFLLRFVYVYVYYLNLYPGKKK